MVILVTGAGLLGAHAAQALQVCGHNVVLYDVAPSPAYLATVLDLERAPLATADVTNIPEMAAVCQQHGVECIVHTAALIGAPVSRQPYRGFEVNVGGSVAVAEAARLAGVRRLIFASSVAIYDLDRLPPGPSIVETSSVGPKNLYGATKVASEQLLDQYSRIYGFEVVHLRFAGIYGRGQYKGGSWMGRKLNRIIEACVAGREESLQPEWLGTQEYVYVRDAAAAVTLVCQAPAGTTGAFNIGTGELHSHADVVAAICQVFPAARINVVETGTPPPSYLNRTQAFDCARARDILGYEPRYTLEHGLREYAAELQQHVGTYERLD
jgi:nucleoside-diphosphate-sugar epimerase